MIQHDDKDRIEQKPIKHISQQYLQPSERAYLLTQPWTGHGYSMERLGEFGQALDFRCRVRFPTACIPVKIVPQLYGQATEYSVMPCGVPCEEECDSTMDWLRENGG
jgi:hypothetical protein